jgi:hypothetical protein
MLRSMMACDMLQHVMGYVGQSSLWIKPPRILWLFLFLADVFFYPLLSPTTRVRWNFKWWKQEVQSVRR